MIQRRTTMTTLWFLPLLLLLLVFLVSAMMIQAIPIELYGLNYNTRKGPDWDPFKCKEGWEIRNDLHLLSRITSRFRLLSLTDCNEQTAQVLEVAQELNLQLWLGLWVGKETDEDGNPLDTTTNEPSAFEKDLAELQRLLQRPSTAAALNQHVIGISVGSEALYRNDTTLPQITNHYQKVKQVLEEASWKVPVTICDIAPEYVRYPALRELVDVTMTNTFPFWEGIPIEEALTDLQGDLEFLTSRPESQGKPFVLGETGWPSQGFIEGVGVASPSNQLQYFSETFCYLTTNHPDWEYYWFTGIDNTWRQEQDPLNTIEGNWGFLHANLTLKAHFEDYSFSCPGDDSQVVYDFGAIDWTLPGFTAAPTVLDPASCMAHPQCQEAGLLGNCCPAPNGLVLGCCDTDSGVTTTAPPPPTPPPLAPAVVTTPSPTRLPTNLPVVVETPLPTMTTPPTTTPEEETTPAPLPVVILPPPTLPPPTSPPPTTGAPSLRPTAAEVVPTTLSPTTTVTEVDDDGKVDDPEEETPVPVAMMIMTPEPTSPTAPSLTPPTTPTPKPTIAVIVRPDDKDKDNDDDGVDTTSQPNLNNGGSSGGGAAAGVGRMTTSIITLLSVLFGFLFY